MKKQLQLKTLSKWCLALLLAMFSVNTYGQQSVGTQFNLDGIRYKIASPTEVEIVGYSVTVKEVTISRNVTSIGARAFQDNPDLHLVTVEANDPPVINN